MANSNPFRWVEIYVQDTARAKKFYETVVKATFQRLESPEAELWAFPMAQNGPGAAGALVKMQGMPSGANSVIVYFACEDLRCRGAAGRPRRREDPSRQVLDRRARLHRARARYRRQHVRIALEK
jgi:hypothetical protein